MKNIKELFGSMVFNDAVMQERLPRSTYKALKSCLSSDTPLDIDTANVVANAMKDWAIEKGCTHFTHCYKRTKPLPSEKSDSITIMIFRTEKHRCAFSAPKWTWQPKQDFLLLSTTERRTATCLM